MRLIDADRLLQGYEDHDFIDTHIIWNAPTVDAVPVIRCKDCKWFGDIGCAISIVDDTDKPSENDYCSWAERRNDETD